MTQVLAAVIAAIVAGSVAWGASRNSRSTWVLEKRYEVYRAVLDAASGIAGQGWLGDQLTAVGDRAKVQEFTDALAHIHLVAPYDVRRRAAAVSSAAWTANASKENVVLVHAFGKELTDFVNVLWMDLVPPRMRDSESLRARLQRIRRQQRKPD